MMRESRNLRKSISVFLNQYLIYYVLLSAGRFTRAEEFGKIVFQSLARSRCQTCIEQYDGSLPSVFWRISFCWWFRRYWTASAELLLKPLPRADTMASMVPDIKIIVFLILINRSYLCFRSVWSLFFPSLRSSSTSSTPPGCHHTHLFSRSFPSHLPHWLKSALRGQRKPINFRFCLISLILCVQEHHVLLHFAWFDFVPGMLLIHASCGRKRLLLLLFHFHFCFRDGVETCTPWVENTTQQIDLAFNIFFMVYFFIRVSLEDGELNINLHCSPVHSSFWQVLVHAGGVLLRRLLHHPTFFCLHLSW